MVAAANAAGLEQEHERVLPSSDYSMAGAGETDAAAPTAGIQPVEAGREQLVADRVATGVRIHRLSGALTRVRDLLDVLAAAESELAASRRRDDAAETKLSEALATRTAAEEKVEEATERYTSDVEVALGGLTELSIPDEDFTKFTEWVRDRDGENPATVALRVAGSRVASEVYGRKAAAAQSRDELGDRRVALEEEITALEGGEIVGPPSAHTRSLEVSGLPLWRAVSFRDDVSDADRAGFEAALEASGLLTAVVLADGEVRLPQSGEVILRAGPAGAATGRTMRDVLRVESPAGTGVGDDTIDAVLGTIVLAGDDDDDPAPVWVSASGRFRLGAARGAWSKDSARYVGE
ncbi:MAG: hypothetical protein ACRDLR_07770, partial [Gaiellaceae bacterium]